MTTKHRKPGRPEIGGRISPIALGAALLARIDAARGRTSRASWLRSAAEHALTCPDTARTAKPDIEEQSVSASVHRAYPDGWELSFGTVGSAEDDTLCVPFLDNHETVAYWAGEAQAETGAPMEVFQDASGDWCYRPDARTAKPTEETPS